MIRAARIAASTTSDLAVHVGSGPASSAAQPPASAAAVSRDHLRTPAAGVGRPPAVHSSAATNTGGANSAAGAHGSRCPATIQPLAARA